MIIHKPLTATFSSAHATPLHPTALLRTSAALALALAAACGPKDTETTSTTDPSTSAASDSTAATDPTTGATQGSSTTSAGTGSSSTGEPPPPVECDGTTCAEGQLCLWPPSYCDYNEMPPEVKRGGKMCADFPASCANVTEGLATCLSEALCTNSVLHEGASYEMGLLDCFPAWNDCF